MVGLLTLHPTLGGTDIFQLCSKGKLGAAGLISAVPASSSVSFLSHSLSQVLHLE